MFKLPPDVQPPRPDDPLDEDGYPTGEALAYIEGWPIGAYADLLDYIASLWHWPDYFEQEGLRYTLHTGGWSGNESLIGALEDTMFWSVCWESSRRGGHYTFVVPEQLARRVPEPDEELRLRS